MTGSLSIVFTGLCALVGNGDGRPAEVLLLNAPAVGEAHGIALPEHAPTLVVSLSDLANPDTSAPTRVVAGPAGPGQGTEQVGLWDLSDAEVRIRVEGAPGAGVRLFRPAESETAWPDPPDDPDDPAGWRDIRYVADMSALAGDGRIDPAFLGPADGAHDRLVAARIHLDDGLLEGALPSQASYREDHFAFRGAPGAPEQALTDAVRWTLATSDAAVAIDIVPRQGGPARRLLLAPSAAAHRLYVSNLPVENGPSAHARHVAGEAGIAAHHFGAYYALLLHGPADEPLPVRLRPIDTRRGAGLIGPIFCPPALFAQP